MPDARISGHAIVDDHRLINVHKCKKTSPLGHNADSHALALNKRSVILTPVAQAVCASGISVSRTLALPAHHLRNYWGNKAVELCEEQSNADGLSIRITASDSQSLAIALCNKALLQVDDNGPFLSLPPANRN